MATLAGELIIKMGLEIAELRRNAAESLNLAKTQAKAWESAASTIKAGLAGIAASFTLDKAIESFHEATSALAAMDDAAEISGTSVERLSGLMGVATEAGVGLNGLTDVMQKLTKATLGNEQESAKAAMAWKALKIDPTQFSDPADLLMAVSEGFSGWAEGARKAEFAQALLGKSGQQMLPLLKDIAEGGAQQGKITAEMASEAERLEKQWARLSYEGGVFRQTIYSKIIPSLADLVSQFNKARAAGLSFFDSLNTIPGAGADKNSQIDTTLKQISELEKRKKSLEAGSGMQDFFKSDRITATNNELERLNKTLGVLRGQKTDMQKRDGSLSGVYGFGSRPGLPDAPSISDFSAGKKSGVSDAERIAKAQNEALIAAQRKLATLGEESSLATTYFEMTSGKYAEFDRSTKNQLITLAKMTDERKKFAEQEAKIVAMEYDLGKEMQKIADMESAKNRADVDKVAGIVGQTPTAIQEEKARLQYELDKRAMDSGMTEKQHAEATAILHGLSTEAKKTKDIFEELGATFESAFEKAIDGGATFSDFMSGLGKDLGKIFAREFITGPIMAQFKELMKQMKDEVKSIPSGQSSSSGSGVFGLLSSGFKLLSGLGTSSDPGGSFSEGNYQAKSVTNIINIDSRADSAYVRASVSQGVKEAYAMVADSNQRNVMGFK